MVITDGWLVVVENTIMNVFYTSENWRLESVNADTELC